MGTNFFPLRLLRSAHAAEANGHVHELLGVKRLAVTRKPTVPPRPPQIKSRPSRFTAQFRPGDG